MTPAATWKARRIANNPRVTLALCTYQGKVLSPAVAGVARRLSGKEARRARALLRVSLIGWMWNIIFSLRYPGDKTAVYEVSLVAERQTSQAEEEKDISVSASYSLKHKASARRVGRPG